MVKRPFVVQGIACVVIVLKNLPDPSQITKKEIKLIEQKKFTYFWKSKTHDNSEITCDNSTARDSPQLCVAPPEQKNNHKNRRYCPFNKKPTFIADTVSLTVNFKPFTVFTIPGHIVGSAADLISLCVQSIVTDSLTVFQHSAASAFRVKSVGCGGCWGVGVGVWVGGCGGVGGGSAANQIESATQCNAPNIPTCLSFHFKAPDAWPFNLKARER